MALVKRLDHPIVSTTASLYRVAQNDGQEVSRRFVTAFDLDEERGHMSDEDLVKHPADEEILTDPDVIEQRIGHSVDLIIDVGPLPFSLSTVVDLTNNAPKILRKGIGDTKALE
jgi:tRNA A37 threonylcarbamoyladenosine synthetase subunit TsaC/SUA5/YrdC